MYLQFDLAVCSSYLRPFFKNNTGSLFPKPLYHCLEILMFLGKGRNPREMIGSANGIKKFNFLKKPVISITSKLEIFKKIVEYLRIVKKGFL